MGTNEKQLGDVITSILRVRAPGITVLVVNQDHSCHPDSHVDHQAIFSYKGMTGEQKPESSLGGPFLEVYFSSQMGMRGGHKWLLWKASSFLTPSHHMAVLIFPCNISSRRPESAYDGISYVCICVYLPRFGERGASDEQSGERPIFPCALQM